MSQQPAGHKDRRFALAAERTRCRSSKSPPPTFEHRLEVGEVIKTRVTADDGLCGGSFPYPCRHYGLAPRTSGVLVVTMTWGSGEYPLDIGVYDPQGREWPSLRVQGDRREVVLPVTAGATYVIEVWSFLTPGEESNCDPLSKRADPMNRDPRPAGGRVLRLKAEATSQNANGGPHE